MVDGAKFNSHDSCSHFKKLTFKNDHWKKNSYTFVYLKLQVNWACSHYTGIHTFLMVKKSPTFLEKKKNSGMRLKLSIAPLISSLPQSLITCKANPKEINWPDTCICKASVSK